MISSSTTLTLNPTSDPVNATVQVTGTGFSASDSNCTLSGSVVTASSCSVSNGALTGSFEVVNLTLGSYLVTATGTPTGDSGSATLTIVTGSVTTTSSATADFALSATPTVAVQQGQEVSIPITLTSLNGFSTSSVVLTPVWIGTIPSGVNLSIASPIALSAGGTATSSLYVSASATATVGTYAVQVGGVSGSLSHTVSITIVIQGTAAVTVTTTSLTTMTSSNSTLSSSTTQTTSVPVIPTNCPVSSAISGTSLASFGQLMRSFRDQSIDKTRTGSDFMILFNSWYYSFSPGLAAQIQKHPTQRAIFRDALYPLFGILYASYYSYLMLSPLGGDLAAVAAGVVAASLIGMVYFAPFSYPFSRILRRFKWLAKPSRVGLWVASSAAMLYAAYVTGLMLLTAFAETNLLLCSLTLGCLLGTYVLRRLEAILFPLLFVPGIHAIRDVSYLVGHFISSHLRSLE
ncbi:MAG TPA: hypothetical protein VEI80_05375 [Candidatus Acidoferrales bacterium]|nr:hypothetical protein [Candidatus Acidoferrales bacterium]